MKRGGMSELEIEHGRVLLSGGEAKIWGWGTPAGQERVRRRIAWLKKACDIKPGLKVLECGCGTGIFTRQLAEIGADITAVDISLELLTRARQECPASNVQFLEADLEKPDVLEDGYFDVICGVSVLHHLDLAKALNVLRTKLKPGARFAFSEPNLLNPINKYYIFVQDPEKRRARGTSPTEMAFRPCELRNLFNRSGYSLDGLALRDFMHPAVPESLIPLAKKCERIAEMLPLVRLWSGSIWVWGKV
jgi:2-polyprenyl-3-methyl-5-hydroxy-6-metoxy-1,4-benzoquinol methylase